MQKNLRKWVGAAAGAAVALVFSSCAYDPYYGTSVGGSYSSGGGSYSGASYSGGGGGYGDGYGYGGSSFTTSIFVGTGNPQWGYDPYSYSYYDYSRRCYYDPYLNGYYPLGYRPPVVYGVPHPYGWQPGRGYIRPPGRVSSGGIVDYRNREGRYRDSDYRWANQVGSGQRVRGQVDDRRSEGRGSTRSSYQNFDQRQRSESRSSYQGGSSQRPDSRMRQSNDARSSFQGSSRESSRYNSPVSSRERQSRQTGERQVRQSGERVRSKDFGNREPASQRSNSNSNKNKGLRDDDNRVRGYR